MPTSETATPSRRSSTSKQSSKSVDGAPSPSHNVQTDLTEPEEAPTAQPLDASAGEAESQAEQEEDDKDADPSKPIESFAWDDLEQRYHKGIETINKQEAELMQEWSDMEQYFRIWAAAGQHHEAERTLQRLRTRIAYVQHAEQKQENARNHHNKVVKAFEGALALLQKDDHSD